MTTDKAHAAKGPGDTLFVNFYEHDGARAITAWFTEAQARNDVEANYNIEASAVSYSPTAIVTAAKEALRARLSLVEAVRAWARADCGPTEADGVLAALAEVDDMIARADGLPKVREPSKPPAPRESFHGNAVDAKTFYVRRKALYLQACLLTPKEIKAIDFATMKHACQLYGKEPYLKHLIDVRRVLLDFGYEGAIGEAGWTHDVLEDTLTTSDGLTAKCGLEVTNLVFAVSGFGTRPGEPGSNRARRNAEVYEKLKAFPRAIPLKLADRIANVEACKNQSTSNEAEAKLEMYRNEATGFYAALHQAGGELLRGMWHRLNSAYGEVR